jgi:2-oxoglutarate ferredoxin oxidoreductase subunit gamma
MEAFPYLFLCFLWQHSSCGEIRVPIIELAKNLGNPKVANIVALGAFTARSKVVDFDLLRDSIENEFTDKEELIPINLEALEEDRKSA